MQRNENFRPFGGGSTLCAGRFIAVKEALRFVGSLVAMYEVEMEDGQAFLRVEGKKPTFGLMGVVGVDDLRIRVTRRKKGV